MAHATSISFSKFTEAVQAAVQAAVAKHPKFKIEPPDAVTVSYLIRGFPPPEAILAHATLAESQAFATDVAAHIASTHPQVFASTDRGPSPEGAVLSVGRHVIVGIPPVLQAIRVER